MIPLGALITFVENTKLRTRGGVHTEKKFVGQVTPLYKNYTAVQKLNS